jgi:hypothetical protein
LNVFNIDTIKEIAKVNKWETEFIETGWAGFTDGLDSGRFDISVVPTFVTVPRALSVYFTKPMFFAGNSGINSVPPGEIEVAYCTGLSKPSATSLSPKYCNAPGYL